MEPNPNTSSLNSLYHFLPYFCRLNCIACSAGNTPLRGEAVLTKTCVEFSGETNMFQISIYLISHFWICLHICYPAIPRGGTIHLCSMSCIIVAIAKTADVPSCWSEAPRHGPGWTEPLETSSPWAPLTPWRKWLELDVFFFSPKRTASKNVSKMSQVSNSWRFHKIPEVLCFSDLRSAPGNWLKHWWSLLLAMVAPFWLTRPSERSQDRHDDQLSTTYVTDIVNQSSTGYSTIFNSSSTILTNESVMIYRNSMELPTSQSCSVLKICDRWLAWKPQQLEECKSLKSWLRRDLSRWGEIYLVDPGGSWLIHCNHYGILSIFWGWQIDMTLDSCAPMILVWINL